MDKATFIDVARRAAGSDWNTDLGIILGVGYDAWLILGGDDFERLILNGSPTTELTSKLRALIGKYVSARANHVGIRVGKPLGTVADPAVTAAISGILIELSFDELERISYGHRLSMAAENIMGYLLEAYLASALADHGFIHCAGEILRSVDFVTREGKLLQVKNSDNTENSSSGKIRRGTQIEHWWRRRSKPVSPKSRLLPFNWTELNSTFSIPEVSWLTEENFQAFVREAVTSNPRLIHTVTTASSEEDAPGQGGQLGLGL